MCYFLSCGYSANLIYRFERELEALRKELAEATATRPDTSTPSGRTSPSHSDAEASSNDSPVVVDVEGSVQPDRLSLDSNSIMFTPDSKKDR